MFEKINDNLAITAPDETDDNPIVIAVLDRESANYERWVCTSVSLKDLQELYEFIKFHFGIGL